MIKWRHTSITALKRVFKVFHINSLTPTILQLASAHTTTGFRSRTLQEQLFFLTLVLLYLFVKTSFKDFEECLCYNVSALSYGTGALTVSWLLLLLLCWVLSLSLLSSSTLLSPVFLSLCPFSSGFLSFIFLSSGLWLFLSSGGMVWPLTSLRSTGSVCVSLSMHRDSVTQNSLH